MKKLIISFSALLLIVACEKEIEFTPEEVVPRIVVNSIFAQGDTIWMNLSESRNILYEGVLPIIENANAQLLDINDNVIGTFIYDDYGMYYCTSVAISLATTYGVRVEASGFNSVTASSLLPNLISLTSLDTVDVPNDELDFKLSFLDDASQTNFYGISIIYHGAYIDEIGEVISFQSARSYTSEVFVANGTADIDDGRRYDSEYFFSDNGFNGQTIDFKCTTSRYEGAEPGGYFVVQLKNLNVDLYKYYLSLRRYKDANGNPFAEPVQVYSNITDGFGIFGGTATYRDTIWIE
jgi:hypothetical protein